jgi:hypothetical protein
MGYIGGMNFYSYVNNSPLIGKDPLGLVNDNNNDPWGNNHQGYTGGDWGNNGGNNGYGFFGGGINPGWENSPLFGPSPGPGDAPPPSQWTPYSDPFITAPGGDPTLPPFPEPAWGTPLYDYTWEFNHIFGTNLPPVCGVKTFAG